jgi:hypothetical protein
MTAGIFLEETNAIWRQTLEAMGSFIVSLTYTTMQEAPNHLF